MASYCSSYYSLGTRWKGNGNEDLIFLSIFIFLGDYYAKYQLE